MSETWVINETVAPITSIGHTPSNFISFGINFSVEGVYPREFSRFDIHKSPISWDEARLRYYEPSIGTPIDVLSSTLEWLDEAYRTVTFDTAPAGDLLTWLQANAVKQQTKITLDLSTLNLPEGTHSIQMSLSGSGKRDSELSEAVEYTVSSGPETWVMNSSIHIDSPYISTSVNFTSNNTNYTLFEFDMLDLKYNSTVVYNGRNSVWTDQNYRTLTFERAPTGDLLTFLQYNAEKQ